MSTESYVKLRKLTTQDGESIEDILHRAADHLRGLAEKATIQLRLIRVGETGGRGAYSMQLTPAGAFLQTEGATKPALVVITTAETFRHIAEGAYSPVQAYLDGKLHLHGDVDLGRRVIRHLAGSGTEVQGCLSLEGHWHPDGNGQTGSLTITGRLFTPGGPFDVHFDYGGGQYRQIGRADASGMFTIIQGALFCGDIPGRPGVGVIVTAFDLNSEQSTTVNFSTPCS
jgi:hypothetical protein